MKNNERSKNSNAYDDDPLLISAERHLINWNKWWPRLWAWNCWLTGAAVIISGFVPFGLGLLLYTPPQHAQALNIILIIASALAFVAQAWNVTQRNGERAKHIRQSASDLEGAIAFYRSGKIARDEFADEYRAMLERNSREPMP